MEKVLWGFYNQTFKNFEIIIADDGSGEETQLRIKQFIEHSGMPVKHVWQQDDGFQKTRILNKALVASSGDYIVFTDGDCIPRQDFLQVHVDHAQKGYLLSGGYFKLPMPTSLAITKQYILSGHAFDPIWLLENGLKKTHKLMKLNAKGFKQKLYNKLTLTKATWNGHNVSAWREDIFAVNGFDERMQYGGEDREMGERMFNFGIKSKQIRYSAICVHLDHARGYVEPQMIAKNKAIRQHTKDHKITRTEFGIERVSLSNSGLNKG